MVGDGSGTGIDMIYTPENRSTLDKIVSDSRLEYILKILGQLLLPPCIFEITILFFLDFSLFFCCFVLFFCGFFIRHCNRNKNISH